MDSFEYREKLFSSSFLIFTLFASERSGETLSYSVVSSFQKFLVDSDKTAYIMCCVVLFDWKINGTSNVCRLSMRMPSFEPQEVVGHGDDADSITFFHTSKFGPIKG
jgi:hypothetical protein